MQRLVVVFRHSSDSNGSKRYLSRRLWPAVTVALGIFVLGLVSICHLAEGRIPRHDSFDYCTMQYSFFFNEPALHGRIPLWNPFVCHGSSAAWNVFTTMNIGAAIVALCGLPVTGIESPDTLDVQRNDRLTNAEIAVASFSFDELRLRVANPGAGTSVLYYADAWHPGWRACVNGANAPVLCANIGYKAVRVPPGHSDVVLMFGTATDRWLLRGVVAIALLACGCILWLGWRELHLVSLAGAVMHSRTARFAALGGVLACTAIAAAAYCSDRVRECLACVSVVQPWDAALNRLETATPPNARTARFYLDRGRVHHQRGSLFHALADYDKALSLDARCDEAYARRGMIRSWLHDYDRATADAQSALELDPSNPVARALCSHVKDKALADCACALAANSRCVPALQQRGSIYVAQGNYGGAIDDFCAALDCNPSLKNVRSNLLCAVLVQVCAYTRSNSMADAQCLLQRVRNYGIAVRMPTHDGPIR